MRKFFYPRSVAVVGVSEDPDNLGRNIVNNLLAFDFRGQIFPVGPKGGRIHDLTILPSLMELPQPVDLVAILAPAPVVPALLDDCGRLGIDRVVVESGGFSEHSEGGRQLEGEVRERLQRYGIRMMGPNGLGVMNLEVGLCLPFVEIPLRPRLGGISLACQSGGVGSNLLAWLAQEGMGVNKFISMGNKLDVNENDLLAYLSDDPETKLIYLYLEDIADGHCLMEVARRATKPVILHKANIGELSAAIAASHTASMLVDDRVVDAACEQAGILRVRSRHEFLRTAMALMQPPLTGNRLVVLSRSGGEAVVVADACSQYGFELPPLSAEIKELIGRRSRAGVIQPINPLDLGDVFDFTLYRDVAAAFCRDPQIDGLILNYGPVAEAEKQEARASARAVIDLARENAKPLAITVVSNLEEVDYFRHEVGMPVFSFPGDAVRALALARDWAKSQPAAWPDTTALVDGEAMRAVLGPWEGKEGALLLPEALRTVLALGMPVPGWEVAGAAAEAVAAAARLGYPVCLKLVAPGALHKSDLGGIKLDLKDPVAVETAYAALEQAALLRLPPGEAWNVLVMQQAGEGIDVVLGAKRDRSFGPVIMFGAGGIWVEFLQDVALAVAPLDEAGAWRLMERTKISALLKGRRGQPPMDLAVLSDQLVRLAGLMVEVPEIQEVDLNPVRVFPAGQGALVLDARIILGPPAMGRCPV